MELAASLRFYFASHTFSLASLSRPPSLSRPQPVVRPFPTRLGDARGGADPNESSPYFRKYDPGHHREHQPQSFGVLQECRAGPRVIPIITKTDQRVIFWVGRVKIDGKFPSRSSTKLTSTVLLYLLFPPLCLLSTRFPFLTKSLQEFVAR